MQHGGQGQPSFLLWSTQEELMREMDIWIFHVGEWKFWAKGLLMEGSEHEG